MIARGIARGVARGIARGITRGGTTRWSPADLFAEGQDGLWIDYAPDYTFSDTGLTTPANPGEGIAGYVDRSGNGYDGTQSVITARPVFREGPHRAEYDVADDALPSSLTIPSISEGCFILMGTAGIWIDNEYVNTSEKLTVGPNVYTEGPRRALSVCGDVLSIIVRDAPLSDSELDKVLRAGIKRGSASALILGPELLANPGRPFTDTAGWQPSNGMTGATISVSDGNLVLTSTGPDAANALTEFGFEQGKTYLVEFGIVSSNLIGQVRANGFANLNTASITGGIIGSGQAQVGRNWAFYTPGSGLNAFGIGGRSDVTELVISYASIREVFPLTDFSRLRIESGDLLLTEGGYSFWAEEVV